MYLFVISFVLFSLMLLRLNYYYPEETVADQIYVGFINFIVGFLGLFNITYAATKSCKYIYSNYIEDFIVNIVFCVSDCMTYIWNKIVNNYIVSFLYKASVVVFNIISSIFNVLLFIWRNIKRVYTFIYDCHVAIVDFYYFIIRCVKLSIVCIKRVIFAFGVFFILEQAYHYRYGGHLELNMFNFIDYTQTVFEYAQSTVEYVTFGYEIICNETINIINNIYNLFPDMEVYSNRPLLELGFYQDYRYETALVLYDQRVNECYFNSNRIIGLLYDVLDVVVNMFNTYYINQNRGYNDTAALVVTLLR